MEHQDRILLQKMQNGFKIISNKKFSIIKKITEPIKI